VVVKILLNGIAGGAGSLNGDNGEHRVRFRESALEDTF
jgi:hypothetical protein